VSEASIHSPSAEFLQVSSGIREFQGIIYIEWHAAIHARMAPVLATALAGRPMTRVMLRTGFARA
jgi:hypothetical protein